MTSGFKLLTFILVLMEVNVNKKIEGLIEKLSAVYGGIPYNGFILQELQNAEFKKFLKKRIEEANEYKMNIDVANYFSNFKCYPDRIENVIVVNKHESITKLRELGFFKDLNSNLFLVLNNTFSTNKQTGKIKSHYEYWRIFTANALDYLSVNTVGEIKFFFIGDDVAYDFAELIQQSQEKFLLPTETEICWSDGSMKNYDFLN